MAEMEPKPTNETEEQSSYTPASFAKRTAAWMGIVYALMCGFIITFSLYRPDASLAGTFPLFLVPVAVACIVVTVQRMVKRTAPGGIVGGVVICILCAVLAAMGLWLGVPPLAAVLGG